MCRPSKKPLKNCAIKGCSIGLPCVDMERKLFITSRSKTFEKRWTQIVDGDLVIPMMNRTHTAVGRWLAYRESLVAELSDRRELFRRIQRASEARRLAKTGRSYREIAAALDITGTAPRTPARCGKSIETARVCIGIPRRSHWSWLSAPFATPPRPVRSSWTFFWAAVRR